MWYQINTYPEAKDHVIYKLWYHEKYVVVAGKTIERSVENLNIGLKYFFKDTPKGRNPNDIFYQFYCHVDDFPYEKFTIELLNDTSNPYQHFKEWFLQLLRAKEDINCLNLYFEPYIPNGTNKNGQHSWINRGYYLNYMQFRKKFGKKLDIR